MAEIIVAKAEPTGTAPTPDTHIYITGLIPRWCEQQPLSIWDEYCEMQAEKIEEALIQSLPGGVYDRLLGRMLARKATHFRVAHGAE